MEEKQQALSDLNSMEKSFSDLFKRLEKQKDALEGYHRVRWFNANNILPKAMRFSGEEMVKFLEQPLIR